ncbi:hypothetical protein H4R18_003591 [Coemansia javaensis]|uniref:PAS domain-containing protein n=1 Tax=Coemansia javaensis TaxID=2761396 RepID=A0A9W8H7E4_9FUNG|nr:hypothetical protein H4R18_003591 [Coemansia javaensis]
MVAAGPHIYFGIHTRDESARMLYISEGVQQVLGFTPAEIMSRPASEYIADSVHADYPLIFTQGEEKEGEDAVGAYVFYLNVKTATGASVLERVTAFACDTCVVFVCLSFPDAPFRDRRELEVQVLDREMTRLNVSRHRRHRSAAPQPPALFRARSRLPRAALVVEFPPRAARCPAGPLITFASGSIGRLVDADADDLDRCPFLRLVALEDVVRVCALFERLAASTDVQHEAFSLLRKPHVIAGDVPVADADNPRVAVECLAAAAHNGAVLLLRAAGASGDGGHLSLLDLVSSDPETSDAHEWAQAT